MRRQLLLFLCALQFLTRIPVRSLPGFEPDWIARSTRYAPLVGLLVGLICAGVLLGASLLWPGWLPALLAVAAGILVTGAFHEDGLADTADGLGGGGDPMRRLLIMKDSRIGTYGALALGMAVALKVAALAGMAADGAALALVIAHAGARAVAILAMHLMPYAGDPEVAKFKPMPVGVRSSEAALALLIGLAPMLLLPRPALAGLALGGALALLLALQARRLVGGQTGDVLGAIEQVCETGMLLGIAAVIR